MPLEASCTSLSFPDFLDEIKPSSSILLLALIPQTPLGGRVIRFPPTGKNLYALGKAQEIIGIVNSYLNIPVVASWTVARISEKHREHGIMLEYLSVDEREGLEALRQGECNALKIRKELQGVNMK